MWCESAPRYSGGWQPGYLRSSGPNIPTNFPIFVDIRRFIREGRLPAKRIGKEYRITRAALDEFAGTSAAPDQAPIARTHHVLVSSIVDVDAISPEDSQRISTL